MLQVVGGEAGMHLAALLPKGFRDEAIAEKAALQKLWLWPLSPSYLGESPKQDSSRFRGHIRERDGTSCAEATGST